MSRIRLAGITGFTGGIVAAADRAELLSSGSLVSVEPGNLADPWGSVPATSTAVPNLAAAQCNALVGSGAADLLFVNEFDTAEGTVELSAAGGLHVIKKQAAGQTVGRAVRVTMTSALRTYLATNSTHDIYVSWWGKRTRVGLSGAPVRYTARIAGTSTGQITAGLAIHPTVDWTSGTSGSGLPSDARRIGFSHNANADKHFLAIASTSVAGDFGGTTHASAFIDGIITSSDQEVSPSYLTWALYVEDLTVSGRAFAEVEDIDSALYTAMVLTSGGHYHDDTYTDPATV